MNKIEVKVLNPEIISNIEQMMVCSARLTQRGHTIKNMSDFMNLYNKPYKDETVDMMNKLSHSTIKRFGVINVVVVGASRRFLAQITRAQVGVTFTSASLQYSNYGNESDFCVPYNILEKGSTAINEYLNQCKQSMTKYLELNQSGIDNDSCGYVAPQGLRNVLIISANVVAWQHMISQRTCKRNTKETQYVMLKIWEELYKLNPILFSSSTTGPECCKLGCLEGKFSCKKPICKFSTPTDILKLEFPLFYKE